MSAPVNLRADTRSPFMPAPLVGPGVCATCRGPVRAGSVHLLVLPQGLRGARNPPRSLPPIVPMGLYRPGDPWNAVLRRYKDAPVAAARRYFAGLLEYRVEHFLALHGPCLDRETGGFDAFCVVPSSRSAGQGGSSPLPPARVRARTRTQDAIALRRAARGGGLSGRSSETQQGRFRG